MTFGRVRNRWRVAGTVAWLVLTAVAWLGHRPGELAAESPPARLETSFERQAQPFLQANCVGCHNEATQMSGVRLDDLDAVFEDRSLRLWETVRTKIADETMPPAGAPQPDGPERQRMVVWLERALDAARSRPARKNGSARRLTVAQYRNTLRELLRLEDDFTDRLPPDAVSEDGFVNNAATLELSPLLMEAYFEVAEEALDRAIVDPQAMPAIQTVRVELGKSINPAPLSAPLILGANSHLLDNADYVVTQPVPAKPFAFDPYRLRTRYRFIEGYKGNATVRGWRDFDSIYHAVFAGMRGSRGYPKGTPYSPVPEGLLLRPAIPSDEIFGSDGTYGPKANFKISLRELPDFGRFRVTVVAAKYDDGLLLDPGAKPQPSEAPEQAVWRDPAVLGNVTIERAGIYQVDIYEEARNEALAAPDASRLGEGLVGLWPLDGNVEQADGPEAPTGRLEGDARFIESPFGHAVSLDGEYDAVVIPRHEALNVGTGDFTVAAWIHPWQSRRAGIVALGAYDGTQGWYFETASNKGALRIETTGPNARSNGTVESPPGVLRAKEWQHVAAVVDRSAREALLYVNGYAVAKGEVGPANLDNPEIDLHLGAVPDGAQFRGELDEVHIYRRALDEAELQALLEPGRRFVKPPPEKPQEVSLTLGARSFTGSLQQPAFLAVRLPAGPLQVAAQYAGVRALDRIAFTPLGPENETERRFRAFEKRSPKVGVHLGLRRDCGSTFAPVGAPQTVADSELERFVFEGAIRNFPSPDVEKDNVNYLAGIREIAVRSEYTDGRDMPRMLVRSVEFEGPLYESWPPPSHRSIFLKSDRENEPQAYAREIVRSFAARAYRRPATAGEESALVAAFRDSFKAGRGFRASVKDALLVALTSPQFLFLIENSGTPEPEPLDDYELASKLSYFLWNGPPGQTLLKMAEAGTLRKRLDGEVARMIAAPQFSRFVREFAAQWLNLDRFDVLEPDRHQFPKLTRDARAQLRREPIEFLEYLIRNDLPARNLIESDFLVANEIVADYYGLAAKTESGFRFAPIAHEREELGGVLTQAAILAGLSDGRESNPVKRGAWLARRIVAEPPDPPPPNVPDLDADTHGLPLRERLARHRSQPGCVQCHLKIDPWGVPFEEFDAGGRLKRQPVDARSELPDGTEVGGVSELKRYLGRDRIDRVAFSVLKHLATYANGRSLTYREHERLHQEALALKPNGYRMQDLIRYVVNSELFLEK